MTKSNEPTPSLEGLFQAWSAAGPEEKLSAFMALQKRKPPVPPSRVGPLTLTISRAARESGFSRASLYRAIESGALATVPGVNRRRIHRDDLEAFARGQKGGVE